MANGLKKWSELGDKRKQKLGDMWERIQKAKTPHYSKKTGKTVKQYGPTGAAAFLKAHGVKGTLHNLKADYYKTPKRTQEKWGK